MIEKKRIIWIDYLRVFAILAVILCHTTEGIYSFTLKDIGNLSFIDMLIAFSLFTIGRLGVPIFLMITGYLMLDRDYDEKETRKLWRGNWIRLLVCTEIWIIVYVLFIKWFRGRELDVWTILEEIFFLRGFEANHLWYMPMILGMYISLPFVASGIRKYDVRMLIFPLAIFSLYAFGFPLYLLITNVINSRPLSMKFSLGYSGGVYGIYILFGYVLRKGLFKNIKGWILILIAACSFLIGVYIQIWAFGHNYEYKIYYENPMLLFCSVCLFELTSRIEPVREHQWVKWLSKYSFGVYLVHNLYRSPAKRLIRNTFNLPNTVEIAILGSITIILSCFTAWLINQIPKLGKWMIYVKG